MDFPKFSKQYSELVASAADLCMKPWKHAVVYKNLNSDEVLSSEDPIDLTICIECRSIDGERNPKNDLELEIYRSGNDLNLTLSWSNQLDKPVLWQGHHSVWMDGDNGKRCKAPKEGDQMESLARRLLGLFHMD